MGSSKIDTRRRALTALCAAAVLTTTCARTTSIEAAPDATALAAPAQTHQAPVKFVVPTTAVAAVAGAANAQIPDTNYVLRIVGFKPASVAPNNPPPIVVILPGSEGLTWDYVDVARGLAERGVVAVAGCWFRESESHPSTIPCPWAPAFIGANKAAIPAVDTLVRAAQAFAAPPPSTAAQRASSPVYLLGHSRGATMALHVGSANASRLNSPRVDGIIASSAITTFSPGFAGMFDDMPILDAKLMRTPVLLVHPQDDSLVAWSQSASEAQALPRQLVHTWFPPTGEHEVLMTRATDFIAHTLAFIETTQ